MRKDEFGLGAPPEPAEEVDEPGRRDSKSLPWIEVRGSYFATENGEPWTPIGQNDAISWSDFNGLFRRRNIPAVEGHMRWLADHGVTCLRFMLEYAQERHRYFERPIGTYPPNMVQLWDDLFALCEKYGLRVLLTPFDTYWTWLKFHRHPYNLKNGGCLDEPSNILLCRETRRAIKARLTFAVERWGGSGALFAWDLWNEIHPAQAGGKAEPFGEFIHDLSTHVRQLETRLYGRAHPQTVSLFGPELWWRPNMPLKEPIFRHPDLNFASIHIYQEKTIDDPKDTVAPAIAVGDIVRDALAEMPDKRPFLDTEHGPIHAFKDKHITLPEPFDDEYFKHMQWAHFASGGAGGGMRWPNRRPHVLTEGMRRAQRSLSKFLPLIHWPALARINLNREVKVLGPALAAFACGDRHQAIVWLLRTDTLGPGGMLDKATPPIAPTLRIPGLATGRYAVTAWNTKAARPLTTFSADSADGRMIVQVPSLDTDVALAIRPA